MMRGGIGTLAMTFLALILHHSSSGEEGDHVQSILLLPSL